MLQFLPYFWKAVLPDIGFLLTVFFKALWVLLAHCLLTSKISDGKHAHDLIEDSMYMIGLISFTGFKILFLSMVLETLILMCLGVVLFEFISFESLIFLDVCIQMWEVLVSFIQIFSLSFSYSLLQDTYSAYVHPLNGFKCPLGSIYCSLILFAFFSMFHCHIFVCWLFCLL